MGQSPGDLVPLKFTNWEHAHELATVLRRAGFDPEYDPPCPAANEGAIAFAPSALCVPVTQAEEARELIARWRAHSERRVDQIAREVWKEFLPLGLLLLCLTLVFTLAVGSFATGAVFSFLTFLFGGYWFAYRRRIDRQS